MLVRKLLLRNLFCIAVLIAASFHSAYGQNRPNHTDALNQIKNMLSDDSILEITKLVYVNGTQTDINHYLVAVTYTKVFKVSSKTLFDKDGMPLKNPANAAEGALTILSYLVNAGSGNLFGRFEPGDSFDLSCQFIFIGTENGWVLQGPQSYETIVARHTEHADAVDAQEKKANEAYKTKQAEEAAKAAEAAAKDNEHRLVEVKDACASGQQMKIIGYGLVPVKGLQGAGPFGGYLDAGQVVVAVPDDAKSLAAMAALLRPDQDKNALLPGWLKSMCRVQYSVRNRIFSGYVPVERLATIVQPPQDMVAGDPSAQKMVKIPLADALLISTDPATGLMWTRSDNGSDVNWSQAAAYCANLQLGGYSGWRLATIDELQAIYDPSVDIPGVCCNGNAVSWHVKGKLHLSGAHWSNSQGNAPGETWVFIFLTGKRVSGLSGNSQFGRALCVRRSGE